MLSNGSGSSIELEQVAEYQWEEHFDRKVWPIKGRVFIIRFGHKLNRYNASVFVGGDWQLLRQWDYEPTEAELKAKVKAEMPVWKAIGTIY
jgi:hypothetical protein